MFKSTYANGNPRNFKLVLSVSIVHNITFMVIIIILYFCIFAIYLKKLVYAKKKKKERKLYSGC